MPSDAAPPEIQDLANRRAEARRARDWELADRLRAEIEGAGWRIVDAATLWSLERAAPPTVAEGDIVRYGSSADVPSRLADAPIGTATVVVATDDTDDVVAVVRAVAEHAPDGTQVVVVANGVAPADARALVELGASDPGAPGVITEVVWTSARLEHAAALNVGIRRAAAPVVILLGPARIPCADVVSPLVRTLDDPSIAVAGPDGLLTTDLRRFSEAPDDAVDVDAVSAEAIAFRRGDYVTCGPLDERFGATLYLGAWWSLVLRDMAVDGADDEAPARRAVQVADLALTRRAPRAATGDGAGAERRAKKDFYRFLKRFASRRDLLRQSGSGVD